MNFFFYRNSSINLMTGSSGAVQQGHSGSTAWSPGQYPVEGDSVMTYLVSYHWTILAMATIGDLPQPSTKGEYLYVITELIIGLITFATVLGYVANIVTNVSAARKDFQSKCSIHVLQVPLSLALLIH